MRIKISNGFVIDPANNIEAKHDIYIAEGRIAAIGIEPEGFSSDKNKLKSIKMIIITFI